MTLITLRLKYRTQSENVSNVWLTYNALSQENISLTWCFDLSMHSIELLDHKFLKSHLLQSMLAMQQEAMIYNRYIQGL